MDRYLHAPYAGVVSGGPADLGSGQALFVVTDRPADRSKVGSAIAGHAVSLSQSLISVTNYDWCRTALAAFAELSHRRNSFSDSGLFRR